MAAYTEEFRRLVWLVPVFRGVCEGATGHGDGVLLGGHTMLVILAVNCTI